MEEADFSMKSRMKVAVALVEGHVDPEIIRELAILAEIMVDDSLHFMHTPETVILLSQREVDNEKNRSDFKTQKRSDLLNFRDALLNRLARMRAARMNKPFDLVYQGILHEDYSRIDG